MIGPVDLIRRALAAAVLLAAVVTPVFAELAVIPREDGRVSAIMLTIVDLPDPVDAAAWQIVRDGPIDLVLNAGGVVRGDGRPHLVLSPLSGLPRVVWAYNSGPDHDVVIADWTGVAWTSPLFIAGGAADEIDPRLAIGSDGRAHIVWSVQGDGIYLNSEGSGGDQAAGLRVVRRV